MEELEKMNLYFDLLIKVGDFKKIIKKLDRFNPREDIKVVKDKFRNIKQDHFIPIPYNLRAVILDFEGKPPFLLGLMIADRIFVFYINSRDNENKFYLCVLKILKLLKKVVFFSFSNYEENSIANIFNKLKGENFNLSKYKDVKSTRIYNVQERPFESLVAALIKIGFKSSNDPLARNLGLIEYLYGLYEKQGFIDDIYINLIIEHNKFCLLNTVLILVRRFLKRIDNTTSKKIK